MFDLSLLSLFIHALASITTSLNLSFVTCLLIDTRIALPLAVVNSAAMAAGVQGICFECLLLVLDGSLFLELGLVCHMVVLQTGPESHRGEASVSYSNFMFNF